MGRNKNKMRAAIAVITIASLSGGVMAVHAATFKDRTQTGASQDLAVTLPPDWQPIKPTSCVASPCVVDLYAGPGSVTVEDTTANLGTQIVPFLGFGVNGKPVSLAGGETSTIKVPQGTTLTINLSAAPGIELPHLSFPSLAAGSVTNEGNVYTVNVGNKVGTSVFQPGDNPKAPRQIAQGLVGVLIVTPAACTGINLTCAYDGTSHADEALVATTDLDLAFAQNPDTYDMSYFGQSRTDKDRQRQVYHVINGQSFPDTQVIDAQAGDSVLLRYVNAGVTDKTMGLLGLRQTLLARNASPYTDPQTFIAPMVGPGETADVVVQVPLSATAGQRYSLMDQSRQMNHGSAFGFGGALTFINVWAGVPAEPTVDQPTYNVTDGTLTTTGHPSVAAFSVTHYQTLVSTTPPVLDADWTNAALPLAGIAGAPITFTTANLGATAGQTVWVRVQQDGSGSKWSSPASVIVPTTVVSVASATMAGASLTAVASALPPGAKVDALYYSLNDGTFPSGGTQFPTFTAAASVTRTTAVASTLVDGDTVYVRATSPSAVGFSNVAQAAVTGPKITEASFVSPNKVTTITSTSSISSAEYSIGSSAAAAGTGTSAVYIAGVATISPAPSAGDLIWVRVRDANGVWSTAISVSTVIVSPTVDSARYAAPDLTITASATGANVTGYQTVVNQGATPTDPAWSTTTPVSPAASPATFVESSLTPAAGDTVWVRVEDSFAHWSNPFPLVIL